MPDIYLIEKLRDAPEEQTARKEQELTDEQEEDRGILPKTLRRVLMITALLLIASGAVYFAILRFSLGTQSETVEEMAAEPETPVESPAITEGRIARVLGEESGPVPARALAQMVNERNESNRPIGVIPHPYLTGELSRLSATATREQINQRTIYTVTAQLPKIADDQQYDVFVANPRGAARKLGTLVRQNSTLFSLTTVDPFFANESLIMITGPDPGNRERTVTLLSGGFSPLK